MAVLRPAPDGPVTSSRVFCCRCVASVARPSMSMPVLGHTPPAKIEQECGGKMGVRRQRAQGRCAGPATRSCAIRAGGPVSGVPRSTARPTSALGTASQRSNPTPARFDQPAQRRGAAGDQCRALDGKLHLVIRHQLRAQRDHAAAPAPDLPDPDGPRISNPFPSTATQEACRVRAAGRQTGRPTTKRAPSGSEVISAWVGRMFSAQITPPCASTICFEIARPRPEWLPNWPTGRSE